jgi:hypothetical protein
MTPDGIPGRSPAKFGVSQTTVVRDLALIRNDDKEQIAAALLSIGEPEVPPPPDFTEAQKVRRELARDFRNRDAALLRALGFSVDRSARIMSVSPATIRRYLRARDEP